MSRESVMIILYYFTVTLSFTDLLPDFTVTYAVPFRFAVTTPAEVTVTILLLEDENVAF